jgi:hypothetical protein
MSVTQLAEMTKLSMNTIKRAEATNGPAPMTPANAALVVRTLGEMGVTLLAGGGGYGPGVRFANELELAGDSGQQPEFTRRRS